MVYVKYRPNYYDKYLMKFSFFILKFLPILFLTLAAKADPKIVPTNESITFENGSKSDRNQGSNTKASKDTVCFSNSPNSALVIIDMQPYFATRSGNHQDAENKAKLDKINETQVGAIQKAREANIPIIFLEYDCGPCGSTNDSLKTAVANYRNVRFIKKNSDGMFEDYNKYRKELVDYLNKNDIGTLIITGANGGACVLRSITGALENNCNVVALNSGIADFNYKDFIYPYLGQYSHIKPNCRDCSFKEVSTIDKAAEYMVNYSRKPARSGAGENNATTTR